MPQLKNVEKKIEQVEHFRVDFTFGGLNVRGDKENIPQYIYAVAAPGSWTVAEWKRQRFAQSYPGYDVQVYTSTGLPASGGMKLANVRGER